MPLFSVVIPTRNRAHLLKYALQSVLTQSYDDFELIVSDNASTDGTKSLVHSFSDKRIRYVQPGAYLWVDDHWNFALSHVAGQNLLMLADDDCLAGNALSTFADALQMTSAPMIGCQYADYFSPDFWIEEQRNTIRVPGFSGGWKSMDSQQILTECFRFNAAHYPMPTTLLSMQLVKTIMQRVGHFFERPAPEYVAYCMAYATIDRYIYVDKPLVAVGRTPDSLGPRYFWTNTDPRWNELGSDLFKHVPLKGTYVTNGIAEALLRAKEHLPENFAGIELSLGDYYRNYFSDMLAQQRLGRDVQCDLANYHRAIASLPAELQNQVQPPINHSAHRNQPPSRTGWTKLKQRVKRTPSWAFAASLKRRIFHPQVRDTLRRGAVRGEEVGVWNIFACAQWLGSLEPDL